MAKVTRNWLTLSLLVRSLILIAVGHYRCFSLWMNTEPSLCSENCASFKKINSLTTLQAYFALSKGEKCLQFTCLATWQMYNQMMLNLMVMKALRGACCWADASASTTQLQQEQRNVGWLVNKLHNLDGMKAGWKYFVLFSWRLLEWLLRLFVVVVAAAGP